LTPRKSLHLPRQQKMCDVNGKNDGKAFCRSPKIPLTRRVYETCWWWSGS